MAGENGRNEEVIADAYADRVEYLDQGLVDRETVKRDRQERFKLWPEGKESMAGEIDAAPLEDGKWRAKWKTIAALSAPQRRETLRQELEHECDLIERDGHFEIARQTTRVLKEEKQTEPAPKLANEPPRPEMKEENSPPPRAVPVVPKPMAFPEGTWAIRRQERDAQENTVWNSVVTVRGTAFQYDVNQTHDLIDPVNNPWNARILKGLTRYSWTKRYTGKVIRSDAKSFVVKIANEVLINMKPKGLAIDTPMGSSTNREWVFLRVNGGIIDKNNASSRFESVNAARDNEESTAR
jgi:hypothetical protein